MSDKNEHQHKELSDADLKRISEIAAAIKFGSVTLIIQDGRIVQIEKNEKIRLI
ncbi:MAG: YezD family protein [Treponema sp.]|nr:YezD family protein [Treponema sp.]